MKLKDLVEQYGEQEVTNIYMNSDNSYGSITVKLEPPKPKTVWDLKEGDDCYYIDLFGDIEDTGGYLRPLSEAIDTGVVFLTKEEAEKDVERRKVETLLLKHGGRRWFKEGKENWFISFDCSAGLFKSLYTIREHRTGVIYFDTEEQLKKAFEQIGEERIKKALFEVR